MTTTPTFDRRCFIAVTLGYCPRCGNAPVLHSHCLVCGMRIDRTTYCYRPAP